MKKRKVIVIIIKSTSCYTCAVERCNDASRHRYVFPAMSSAGSCHPAEHPPGIGRGAVRPPFLIHRKYGPKPLSSNRPNTADRSRCGPNRRPAKTRVRRTTRTPPSGPDRTVSEKKPFGRGDTAAHRRGQLAGIKRPHFGT